jgi:Zn-dependent protease/predicted transcriptional regulator
LNWKGAIMTGDIHLGRLAGIPFRLHWSWFLAVFLIAWTLATGFFPQTLPEYGAEGGVYWGLGLLAALGLFASILLHELGHVFVARRVGIPVRGIRLFVFGGVAELGGEPRKPGQEILLALGGPVVTIFLIVLFHLGLSLIVAGSGVGWSAADGFLHLQGGSLLAAGSAGLLYYLGMINTAVLLFNLIPAFPLDGGRVLRGIVWSAIGNYLTSTRIAGGVGIAFSWLLFAGGLMMVFGGNLLGGVCLFFLGTFLQNAAQSSIAYAQLQQLLGRGRVADLMRRRPITVEANQPLREVAEQLFLRYPYKAYPVVKDGEFVGMLTLRALQEIERRQWEFVRAGEFVQRRSPLPDVHPQEPVLQALLKLAESGQSRLPVVENGTLVGLQCGRDVMDLMEIRAGLALPRAEPAEADWVLSGYTDSKVAPGLKDHATVTG